MSQSNRIKFYGPRWGRVETSAFDFSKFPALPPLFEASEVKWFDLGHSYHEARIEKRDGVKGRRFRSDWRIGSVDARLRSEGPSNGPNQSSKREPSCPGGRFLGQLAQVSLPEIEK